MTEPAGRTAPVLATGTAALALLALCVWRAATQSISHDEALTWLQYVNQPLSTMFSYWQANNHVLHTLLAWLSVQAFGNSELALRLPALLGAVLCLSALRRLARRACGEGWLQLVAFLLLAANPLVLDFLVAARGYGLALGLLLWAALVLLAQLDAEATDRPARAAAVAGASLLLGACVAANLAFAPAAAGLAGAAVLASSQRLRTAAVLALPGALLALALLAPPMGGVDRSSFITGVDGLGATVDSLVQPTLAHPDAAWRPDQNGALLHAVVLPAGRAIAALLVLLLIVHAASWLRGRATVDADERALRLLGGTLLIALALVVGLSVVGGLLYPSDRTALYLLPLGGLAALLLARRALHGRGRPLAVAALALMTATAIWQLAELQVSGFALWPLDAGTRGFFEQIEQREAPSQHAAPVQLRVAHRFLAPAAQFYQATRAAGWMAPVPSEWRRDEPDGDYVLVPVQLGTADGFEVLSQAGMVRLLVRKGRGR